MDSPNQHRSQSPLQRNLANLKLVSRLLGHELHSQASAKSITLSREAVLEIQTTLDLFIEEASRSQTGLGAAGEVPSTTRLVSSQN